MKRLQRYILSEFSKLLLIAMIGFITVFVMVDVFENMDNIIKNDVPLLPSLLFFAYRVPFIVSQVSPIAVLVSVLLTLGVLSRHGEITAIKAGGIRLLKVLYPLFAAGVVISVAVVIMNESLTPAAMKRAEAFKANWFSDVHKGTFGKEGVWIRTSGGIVNIRRMDLKKGLVHGFTAYLMDKPFRIRERVQARTVRHTDAGWVAGEATIWKFTRDEDAGVVKKTTRAYLPVELLEEPAKLANVENFQRNMSMSELGSYIKALEADGYEAYRYRTDFYSRLSFPLVNFIMIFVGIPFALKTGRQGGIAAGVGLSIVIAFGYWIVFAVTQSLGYSGVLPPALAAAFPDILFLAIGALMIGYVRQ
jgi:lipopolysaccharide export system permease protein